MWKKSHSPTTSVPRIHDSRFARRMAEQHAEQLAQERRDEELTALRASLLSSCQKDRSAVHAVANVFKRDPSTIYRWAEGEVPCPPLRDFFDLLDAIVAAKGAENQNALELARLVRRRYLDPQADEREVTPAVVLGTAAETMDVANGLLADMVRAVSPDSPGGPQLTPEEWQALEPRFERAAELFELLRLAAPSCLRRARSIPVQGGRPS